MVILQYIHTLVHYAGAAHYVYPGANHTRFDHSIGYVTRLIIILLYCHLKCMACIIVGNMIAFPFIYYAYRLKLMSVSLVLIKAI